MLVGHELLLGALGPGCSRRRRFGHRRRFTARPGSYFKGYCFQASSKRDSNPVSRTRSASTPGRAAKNAAPQPIQRSTPTVDRLRPSASAAETAQATATPAQAPRYARCPKGSATLPLPSCRRGAARICTAHASSAPRGLTSSLCEFLEPVSGLMLWAASGCLSESMRSTSLLSDASQPAMSCV